MEGGGRYTFRLYNRMELLFYSSKQDGRGDDVDMMLIVGRRIIRTMC